jgi:hypothetical protein
MNKYIASQKLSEGLVAQLIESGAENYQENHFEIEVEHNGVNCLAIVTLQHPGKPSPHELRLKAEKELSRWQPIIDEIDRRANKTGAFDNREDFTVTVNIDDYLKAYFGGKQ